LVSGLGHIRRTLLIGKTGLPVCLRPLPAQLPQGEERQACAKHYQTVGKHFTFAPAAERIKGAYYALSIQNPLNGVF
jgi:hypothetical protein